MRRFPDRRKIAMRGTACVALALAMLTAGCGLASDDDDAEATTTTEATETTTPAVVTVAPTPTTAADDVEVALTVDSKLSTQGLGPVHIGHQLEDAITASGVGFTVGDDREGCAVYVADDEALTGVTFTMLDDEVHRIDIAAGTITTISGYGIGSAEADIRAAFGDRIEDGPAQGTIQYVPVDAGDLDKRVVWEVDADGEVTRMWTGRLPLVNDLVPCFSRWAN